MNVESALSLVNALIYKPGWLVGAADYSKRFEGAIKIRIDYPARKSERDEAPEYATPIQTHAEFVLMVEHCDDIALYRKVIDKIILIEVHEAREFLRVQPTRWAPFHPHRTDGMKRWGDVSGDLAFGIC